MDKSNRRLFSGLILLDIIFIVWAELKGTLKNEFDRKRERSGGAGFKSKLVSY